VNELGVQFSRGGVRGRSVFEAVAVAFEARVSAGSTQPVNHGGGRDLVGDDLARRREGLVGVTISEALL